MMFTLVHQAKVMLENEMIHQQISKKELRTRLNISHSEMRRILDLKHPTKIETIQHAMEAMNVYIALSSRPLPVMMRKDPGELNAG